MATTVLIKRVDGEYVGYEKGRPQEGYYTDDLNDCITTMRLQYGNDSVIVCRGFIFLKTQPSTLNKG
jgi:hypothetical protein